MMFLVSLSFSLLWSFGVKAHFNQCGRLFHELSPHSSLEKILLLDSKVPQKLMTLALRRLPYLKFQPFFLLLQEDSAQHWLSSLIRIAQREELSVTFIVLPKGPELSQALSFFSTDFHYKTHSDPFIFLDPLDRPHPLWKNPHFHGGFVAHAQREKTSLSVVYKNLEELPLGDTLPYTHSDSYQESKPIPNPFHKKPLSWRASHLLEEPLQTLGIELDGTLFLSQSKQVSPQGHRLLLELSYLNIEVATLNKGLVTQAPQELTLKYPNIQFVTHSDFFATLGGPLSLQPLKSFGTRLETELGTRLKTESGTELGAQLETQLETQKVTSAQKVTSVSSSKIDHPQDFDTHYLLNRLTEEGILIPHFESHHEYKTTFKKDSVFKNHLDIIDLRYLHSSLSQVLKINPEEIKQKKEQKEGPLLLPKGSAFLTSSGALFNQGITAIIHAATGSSLHSGREYRPSLQSVEHSIHNAIELAEKNHHHRIAIPLVGGGIFLSRLGVSQLTLAEYIVKAALNARRFIEVRFVALDPFEFELLKKATDPYKKLLPPGTIDSVLGSLLDFSVHRSSVIVNPGNTEALFGGGLSGQIAKRSEEKDQINEESQKILKAFAFFAQKTFSEP
jgi:O-acetyl-ADP-ribose deacetylase (regulator of RNase III)